MTNREITIEGRSRSGLGTSLFVRSLDLCLDMGEVSEGNLKLGNVVITHGHMDHYGALMQHVNLRLLRSQKTRVFVPEWLEEPTREQCRFWSRIQHNAKLEEPEIIVVRPGEEVCLSPTKKLFMTSFPTVHRIPSQGYTVYEKRSKLKEEYQGGGAAKIIEAKKAGIQVEDVMRHRLLSYTGDTTAAAYKGFPDWMDVDCLVTECTFVGDDISPEKAKLRGHVHVEDIVENEDYFLECRRLVLTHASARYTDETYREALSRLPPWLQRKTTMLVG